MGEMELGPASILAEKGKVVLLASSESLLELSMLLVVIHVAMKEK